MDFKNNSPGPTSSRGYIIALSRWRSRLALLASLITLSFTLYAIAGGMLHYVKIGRDPVNLFHWYTINSNCLTALSAGLIIPFAVEGVRKKHFSYPRWVALLHYCGMVGTTLTMVFSVGITSWVDRQGAFGGNNLYLHIVCPIMVIVSFFMVESGFHYTLKEALAALIPTLIYAVVYIYEVLIVGEENGGWEDMYHMTEYVPAAVSLVGIIMLALGLSLLIRWLYNKMTLLRMQRLGARLWPEDVDPLEINIEMFGLGRYMGRHADKQYVELPLDLIQMIADRYGMDTEKLIKPYIRGFLDSLKDKQEEAI